jgi:deoxycytidylate deaminase
MFSTRKINRWDNKFLLEALFWSRSSHDAQTQCGCVLVKDKTPLSSGYNGFIRDVDDSALPRHRPDKYPYMIHAEQNAIYNCTRLGRSTLGATAYITALPCGDCLQALHQCGIVEIIFTDLSAPKNLIGSHNYATIFKMVSEDMTISYVPASELDETDFIECSLILADRKIRKNQKNFEEPVDK